MCRFPGVAARAFLRGGSDGCGYARRGRRTVQLPHAWLAAMPRASDGIVVSAAMSTAADAERGSRITEMRNQMIDLDQKNLLSFRDAAAYLPQRNGRRIHVSSLYRWATRGVRSVILGTLQVGGYRFTSKEALQRFADRLTEARTAPEWSGARRPFRRRTAKQREEAIRRAEKELAKHGIIWTQLLRVQALCALSV